MDIKITCRACERTFPLSMAVDDEAKPGHCPFCGEVLAFQYAGTFIDTAKRALSLGDEFVRQLTLLAELAGAFRIEPDSISDPVGGALVTQDKLVAEPYESRWPPKPPAPVS